VAALSGFRRKELARLQKQDCDPHRLLWHPRAVITKARRQELIPMSPECGEVLRELWDSLPAPDSPLLQVPAPVTVRKDLRKAKIERQDASGRWVDFHSLRYFFCTQMAKVLPIQKVMLLMRHRSITLTANLYLDLGLTDVAEEGWSIPRIGAPTGANASRQQLGIPGDTRGHSPS
jgi:integrase